MTRGLPNAPAFAGYFADPFLLDSAQGYFAYGSSDPTGDGAGLVRVLASSDLADWSDCGAALRVDSEIGTDVWAPEVIVADGTYWMYYSAGHGITGHHLRVACSRAPTGTFIDVGVNLTPDERFAIDAHPYRDDDGQWYLYFARDVLDAGRPGTHLAVAPLAPTLDHLEGPARSVLEPNADWQIYARNRRMYGAVLDWHTLEGPTVIKRDDTYYLFFSGGSWEGQGYGVSYATAPHPLGPWTHSARVPNVLSQASTGLIGPGHNSLLRLPSGETITAFHAWDREMTKRQMYLGYMMWTDEGPRVQRFDRDAERGLEPLSWGGPRPQGG